MPAGSPEPASDRTGPPSAAAAVRTFPPDREARRRPRTPRRGSPSMILASYLLKALLALILAALGGAFLHNVRGLCPENSPAALARDRLLGLALYAVSFFLGTVAAGRIADHLAAPLLTVALPLALLWAAAIAAGLRRNITLSHVKRGIFAAVATLALFLVASNGKFALPDAFLLLGLAAWLAVTLRSSPGNLR